MYNDILHVKCRYTDSGCTVTPAAKNLNEHEHNCVYKNMRVKQVRGKGKKKMSLSQVKNRQSCKNGRLNDFFDFFETNTGSFFKKLIIRVSASTWLAFLRNLLSEYEQVLISGMPLKMLLLSL